MAKNEHEVKNDFFGFGDKNVAFAKYFIGTSYLNGLVSPDDNIDVNVSNVNFEPDCRNNWHIHHDGFQRSAFIIEYYNNFIQKLLSSS